jgi:uncharacterized protein (TIGR03435 family)
MAERSCLKRRLHALLDLDTRRDSASRAAIAATWFLGLAAALPLAAFHFAPGPAPAPFRHAEAASDRAAANRQPPPPPNYAAPQVAIDRAAPDARAQVPQVAVARVAPDDMAQAQTAAAQPTDLDSQVVFEVASVKHGPLRDYSASGHGGPGTSDPTRWSVENYPLSSLLGIAYGISSYQLFGPSWLIEERFTVNAKLPEGTTKDQLKLMVRNLLIGRFKLAAHFEKRELPGYQLVVSKGGTKLAGSPGDSNQDDDPAKPPAPFKWTVDKDGYPELPPGRKYSMAMGYGRARWRFADESMEGFAGMLGDQIHQPIINATGLTGKYDFVVSWSTAAIEPNAPADSGPSIFAAVQEQLGLKLDSKKIPLDIVVIDHIEKTPSEN